MSYDSVAANLFFSRLQPGGTVFARLQWSGLAIVLLQRAGVSQGPCRSAPFAGC